MGGVGSGVVREKQEAVRARNAEMAELYLLGLTLQQIGDKFGVTRERVRQILRKYSDVTAEDGGACVRAKIRKAERLEKRDARYLEKYGYTFDGYRAVDTKVKRAFVQQWMNAVRRGIGWNLTLRQWWDFWQASGKWPQRGRGQGFVMCRIGDEGPYAIDNIFIATGCENSSEGQRTKKRRQAEAFGMARAAA